LEPYEYTAPIVFVQSSTGLDVPSSSAPPDESFALAEQIVRAVGRRRCLTEDEAEDFVSWARVKLLENRAAIFGGFGGRSTLSTYLTTVVLNLFRDYRIGKWGKWRPSAEARRLGVTAQRLEVLLWRDGIDFEQACEILRRNFRVGESPQELERIATQLPPRPPRRHESLEEATDLTGDDRTEDRTIRRDAERSAARLESELATFFGELPPEDRLVLKLWAEDGLSIAAIAASLQLEQKPLYRRLEQLKRDLRNKLEAKGITWDRVRGIFEVPEPPLRVDYGLGAENSVSEPSHEARGS